MVIGNVLFWCLFCYLLVNGISAVLQELTRDLQRPNPRLASPGTYTVRALIQLGFCVALGVARW